MDVHVAISGTSPAVSNGRNIYHLHHKRGQPDHRGRVCATYRGLCDGVVCMYVLSAASSGESFIIPVATDDAGYLSEERRVVWKRPYLSARAAFQGSPCARKGGPKRNHARDQCFLPIFGQAAGDSLSKQ